MKIRKSLIIICMLLAMVTAGCQQAPPMSAREEIIQYEWIMTDLSGKEYGTVQFRDGKIHISDKNLDFTEECMIDDSSIIVNSKEYGVITMEYQMSGDSMELGYFGKKITLKKK